MATTKQTTNKIMGLVSTILTSLSTLPSEKLDKVSSMLGKIVEVIKSPKHGEDDVMSNKCKEPEPLTAQQLASASPEQQKNMIGERLYPLIHAMHPDQAGKITGMLLEMDNGELLNLLESPEALNAKIMEAISVLQMHADDKPE